MAAKVIQFLIDRMLRLHLELALHTSGTMKKREGEKKKKKNCERESPASGSANRKRNKKVKKTELKMLLWEIEYRVSTRQSKIERKI